MQGVKQLPGLVYNRLKDIPQVPVFTPCLLYTSGEAELAMRVLKESAPFSDVSVDTTCAKVSIVGAGMQSHSCLLYTSYTVAAGCR